MVPMEVVRVAPIGGLEDRSQLGAPREKDFLALARPVRDSPRMAVMTALNFLEKNQVRIEFVKAQAQFMQGRRPPKSKQFGRHALVNVVGRNTQRAHGVPHSGVIRVQSGSCVWARIR